MRRLVFLVLLVASLSACSVPRKAADQIRIDSAAADRCTLLWPSMKPEGRRLAYQAMREGMWVLRYALLGELPGDEALRAHILSMGEE